MVVASLALLFFFVASILFHYWPGRVSKIIEVGIYLIGIYESLLGCAQIIGIAHSNHHLFNLTGTLSNPGPYGGLIAVVMSVSSKRVVDFFYDEKHRSDLLSIAAILAFLLGAIVLPSSLSRAGWLAFALALVCLLLFEHDLWRFLRENPVITIICAIVVIVVAVGVFLIKPDSAVGRLHIWHMYVRAIIAHPLFGTGLGSQMFAFGEAQAHYFASGHHSLREISLSCCPEESFNEFLSIGIQFGVLALTLFVIISYKAVKSLIVAESPLCYGLIAWLVFSLFSYPFSEPLMAVMLACFFGVSLSPRSFGGIGCVVLLFVVCIPISVASVLTNNKHAAAKNIHQTAYYFIATEEYNHAISTLSPLVDELSDDFRYLYDFGYSLHKVGRYVESNEILQKGAAISCDPMFHNIMGKNYEAMELYSKAEYEYMHALNMLPCRLYPYILLMEMNAKLGKVESAKEYALRALALPVNERNENMRELHERAQRGLDALL